MHIPRRAGLALLALALLAGCTAQPPLETPPAPPPTSAAAVPTSAAPVPTPSSSAPTGIVDSGERPGASGSFALNADGTGSYTVAEGDVAGEIATRFGLDSLGQIENADGQKVGTNLPIFPAEVLTLHPNG